LWSGESDVTRSVPLRGAWFSAMSDSRFKRFSESYKTRFGAQPYRVSTLGYDAVLLALRVAKDWKPGRTFPTARLRDEGGFLGLDGAFRFGRNGVVERTMEVREVRAGQVVIVDPAPAAFAN
jgi:branched-chain amino acid transport system substrate-binding protein